MKKRMAHAGAPGNRRTTSGYVMNTNPGPDDTTDSTLEFVTKAMFPKMEKVTTPASRQVIVLTMQVMMASLHEPVMRFDEEERRHVQHSPVAIMIEFIVGS